MIVHSVRELIKVTEHKGGSVYKTESLGLWYIPIESEGPDKKTRARDLGGDEWVSPSSTWCFTHNKDVMRGFEVAGYYPIGVEIVVV